MKIRNPLSSPFFVLVFCIGLLLLPTIEASAQPERRIVPRHEYAVELPELGRMVGRDGDCLFGDDIYPVGDISGDSIEDFIVTRRLCDTTVAGNTPDELTLYYGVRGGVPQAGDGFRVGPTELGATMKFIGAGDFDGDNRQDLATAFHVFGDTSFGTLSGIAPKHLVIWWGQEGGGISLADTTHLSNGSSGWLLPVEGMVQDLNEDDIDDLVLVDPEGFKNQEVIFLPDVLVYLGASHQRWGKEREMKWDWQWWGPPRHSRWTVFSRTQWIDQDSDGFQDFVWYDDSKNPLDSSRISIIYGSPEHLLDTASIVSVPLESSGSAYALLQDVTGDRVPELVMTTGNEESLKIFIGFPGQRIKEQYGTGNELGKPGESVWWGKPWAEIQLPGQMHDGWAPAGWSPIFDFGDGGLDGVGDIWVYSLPDFVCYNGGNRMDSLYDGWIRDYGASFGSGARFSAYAVVGDIDGSGLSTIAVNNVGTSPYTIRFLQPTLNLPETGKFRYLPPGTEKPSGATGTETPPASALDLVVLPNPASGDITLRWLASLAGTARIQVVDLTGTEVASWQVPASYGTTVWETAQISSGEYLLRLTIDGQSVARTVQVIK